MGPIWGRQDPGPHVGAMNLATRVSIWTDSQNMMTSSNGNIFGVTGPLCGEFTGSGEFPTQSPVTRSFDVFFDLRLNKRLSKQPWGWWFETPSWSLWRHCDETPFLTCHIVITRCQKINTHAYHLLVSSWWLFWAGFCFQSMKSHIRNKIMYGLAWITNFGYWWSDLPLIFTNDCVTRENQWQITSSWPKVCYHDKPYVALYIYLQWCQMASQITNKRFSVTKENITDPLVQSTKRKHNRSVLLAICETTGMTFTSMV